MYHFNTAPSAVNQINVSGTTSLDVTSVDIVCVFLTHYGPTAQLLAAGVPVNGGSFSTMAPLDDFTITCRLRAVPTGVDPTSDYLGSYSGPLLRMYAFFVNKDGSTAVGDQTLDEFGGQAVVLNDAAQCGVAGLLTFVLPDPALRAPGTSEYCSFGLPSANITNTGLPNASAIRVDGKNAYLPYSISAYLRAATLSGGLGLTLPQPTLTSSFSRARNGNITVTESAPLKRCSVDNTYPPTPASCPTLVNVGVSFKRVYNIIRSAQQVEIHDSFTSTNGHSHSVTTQYQMTAPIPASPATGAPGYIYPHHATTFSKATLDKVVTGFGTGPASVIVRSDIYALSADDQADTIGYTWSRPPSKIQFSHTDTGFFAMPYALSVPAHGSATLGFAESEALLTADAKKLAALAEGDL
jgi:hypothetical protein